jgi:hypothetical protein
MATVRAAGSSRSFPDRKHRHPHLTGTARQRPQPREQLLKGEGLGEIVVGATVEPVTRSPIVSRAVIMSTGAATPADESRGTG